MMLEGQQLPFILAGVFLMTLQPLLVTLSHNAEGHTDYSPMSSTLLSEVLKLLISVLLFWREGTPQAAEPKQHLPELLQYCVPAVIYFVNNNLVFTILSLVSPTTFQLLSQLKIVFTGLLFRCFLKRWLTFYQYVAIWQLACGTALSQLPRCEAVEHAKQSSFWGLVFSVVSCVLSAFGGIYTEMLMKNSPCISIHRQNAQLYLWGILFNALGIALHDPHVLGKGFFRGYNGWACTVVVNNALNGLAISAILKYADNIARVYAHACSMLVTMVLSIFLFGQRPTPELVLAIGVVGASAVQYNFKPQTSSGPKNRYLEVREETESKSEPPTLMGRSGQNDDEKGRLSTASPPRPPDAVAAAAPAGCAQALNGTC